MTPKLHTQAKKKDVINTYGLSAQNPLQFVCAFGCIKPIQDIEVIFTLHFFIFRILYFHLALLVYSPIGPKQLHANKLNI